MAIIRATVVLQMDSKVGRDEARNVWHFATPAVDPNTLVGKIGGAIEGFYDNIAGYLSSQINSGSIPGEGTLIEFATVDFGGPGGPDDVVSSKFATRTMNVPISGAAAESLPQELACALSFRGNIAGVPEESGITRPRSRRRGRIFVGPLALAALQNLNGNDPQPHSAFRAAMVSGYQALVTALGAVGSSNAQHVVYSPTSGDFFPVEHVYVDNAFDVIRSRGVRGTARVQAAVAQPPLV